VPFASKKVTSVLDVLPLRARTNSVKSLRKSRYPVVIVGLFWNVGGVKIR
jgi:hypothetical protein